MIDINNINLSQFKDKFAIMVSYKKDTPFQSLILGSEHHDIDEFSWSAFDHSENTEVYKMYYLPRIYQVNMLTIALDEIIVSLGLPPTLLEDFNVIYSEITGLFTITDHEDNVIAVSMEGDDILINSERELGLIASLLDKEKDPVKGQYIYRIPVNIMKFLAKKGSGLPRYFETFTDWGNRAILRQEKQ